MKHYFVFSTDNNENDQLIVIADYNLPSQQAFTRTNVTTDNIYEWVRNTVTNIDYKIVKATHNTHAETWMFVCLPTHI